MEAILRLLKLQIDNKTDVLKTKSLKKMIPAILKIVLTVVALTVVVGLVLFRIFVLGFAVNAQLLAMVLVFLQLVSLLFGIGSVISNLYLQKDNELLMCLPVTPNQLFISKIILIYLHELLINAMIAIPIFIALGFVGELGVVFYLSIIPLIVLLPVFPIFLASFISIPVMMILKFLKKHVTLSIVTLLALVIGVLTVYVSLLGSIADGFNIANKQIETVKKINAAILEIGAKIPLYFQIGQAMFAFSKWYVLAVYLGISAVIMALTILLVRPVYFKTAMSALENDVKKGKAKTYKKRSVLSSLLLKEILCVFRSPGYVFEYFLFALLMPFITFSYDKLLMTTTVNQGGQNMIAGSHLMVVAILAMLSNIVSASTVSRDGGNFYITKIVPVNYFAQMGAKLLFNAIFTVTAVIVTMFVSFFNFPVWQIILGSVAVIFASIGHIALSIEMDVKNPVLNFQGNEGGDALQKNTTISAIIGLLIGILMGVIVMIMAFMNKPILPYIILIIASLIFCVRRVYVLILRIQLQYASIEI